MNEHSDWLEQTWEIKRDIAKQYEGKKMSEQLHDMHVSVLKEFRKRGWDYPESANSEHTKCVNANKS